MGGTVVINNAAGRALRQKPAAILAADVLDCAGGFRAGETIYLTFRGEDGGQYVVATGTARYDEATLRLIMSRPDNDAACERHATDVVILEQDVKLLWPPTRL